MVLQREVVIEQASGSQRLGLFDRCQTVPLDLIGASHFLISSPGTAIKTADPHGAQGRN